MACRVFPPSCSCSCSWLPTPRTLLMHQFMACLFAIITVWIVTAQAETPVPVPDVRVRLLDGPDIHQGVLEYFYSTEDQWVAVCGSAIQTVDADVVCKELGFHGADVIKNVTRFAPGSNYTALINVWCDTADGLPHDHLEECSRSGLRDMGDPCNQMAPHITCLTSRLTGGSDRSGGRLEVWSTERGWGKVCSPNFGEEEQTVACRELGYMFKSDRGYTASQFVDSGKPYEWGDVSCTGNENKLQICNRDTFSGPDCPENGDAFASCTNEEYGEGKPPYLAVRLVDGPCETEGRLEAYDGSEYGTICQDYITQLDAQVICRQLGFDYESAVVVPCCDTYPAARVGVLDLFGMLNCTGAEGMIDQCSHPEAGSGEGCATLRHTNDVGIRCQACKHKSANMSAVIGGAIAFIIIVIVMVIVLWYVCCIPKSKYQTATNEKDDDDNYETQAETSLPMMDTNLNLDLTTTTTVNESGQGEAAANGVQSGIAGGDWSEANAEDNGDENKGNYIHLKDADAV